jgi:cell division protein FtsI (penicillin-binding protein 3)
MKKIPGGYWIPLQEIDNINLAKGADIISNLDIRIQDIVHEEIMKQLSITKSEAGVGIVMEVKTGKIVAMTNLSAGKDSIYKENKNYAISQKYAPGSVMKGATVLALLDDGFMKADDLVDIENGRKSFRGDVVRDDENFAHGRPVTFRDALVHSSNVAMAKLSNQYYNQSLEDRKRFINKIKSFGLGRLTGIDLIGEVTPVIKDPVKNKDDFYYTTIPWMAHGYETEYTPIQVLSFYNTIANNGRMMKPYLVDKIVKHEETIDIKPEIVIEKIASDQAITTLRGFLEGVVLEGTATKLKDVGVRIAGKTGTAQVGIPVEGQDMEYNSTFAGYFPANDPKYSIIVVFYRNPKHLYYASQVAVPVVKNIIEKILSLQAIDVARKTTVIKRSVTSSELPDYGLGYSRDFKAIFNHSLVPFKSNGNSRWTEIQGDGRNIVAKAHKYQKNMVPDVTNMGVRDAIYILESLGLNVKTEGYGKVVKQSVEPGSQLNKQKILLTLE